MYQLFQESSLQPGGGLALPDFRRVQAGLRLSLSKVIEFRRQNPVGLNGSHFLVKLIQSLNVPLSLETEIYNDKVRDISLNLAMSLKMTSALSQGRVFTPGVFYGEHVTEALVANIDPFDLDQLEDHWRDMRPIRVLYHPKTDLNLDVPDGRHPSEEAGMAVIAINIPMLASQYRKWRQFRSDVSDDSPRSIMQFLQEIPLPNMLYSHLDVAIVNRLIGLFFKVEMSKPRGHHSFYLTDWTDEVDKALERWMDNVQSRKLDFDTLVSILPTVSAEDYHEILALPDLAFTQQLQWAVVLARLPLVVFLVQFNALTDNPRNRKYLNYLRHYLRQMDLSRVMRTALPNNRYDDVMVLIDNGVVPYL
jgi:hypothetical protein